MPKKKKKEESTVEEKAITKPSKKKQQPTVDISSPKIQSADNQQYVYFPLNTDKTGQTLSFTVKKNPYKLLHTSLDALIRHLQRNQMLFRYYAIIPLSVIPIAKNRFNLDGEVSAILPFKFKVTTVKPLKYDLHHPSVSPMHRQNRLMPSYIYGL